MESVEIHGPKEVYLGDNITLECITGESFPGKHTLQCCQLAQPDVWSRPTWAGLFLKTYAFRLHLRNCTHLNEVFRVLNITTPPEAA